MGSKCRLRLAALVSFCLATVSVAQVVKQGDPNAAPVEPTELHSPMIIETVFAPADRSLWKRDQWPQNPGPWKSGFFTIPEYHNLGKYTCDGLYLRNSKRDGTWDSGLQMKVNRKADQVEVVTQVIVSNPGHVHDKIVTLFLEVLNEDEVVSKTSIQVKVPANWRGKASEEYEEGTLILPANSLKTNPITKLRITMTTRDY